MLLTSITFMGNELNLQDYCTISCKLIWLSPVTRHLANRPCETKQNKDHRKDHNHQVFHYNFRGKKRAQNFRHGSSWVKLKRKPVGCWECPDWKHMLVAWISTQRFCSVLAQWLYWHIIHQPQLNYEKNQIKCSTGTTGGLSWIVSWLM